MVAELFEISNGQFIEDELRLRDYDFRIGSVSKTRWLISGERERERMRERERERRRQRKRERERQRETERDRKREG